MQTTDFIVLGEYCRKTDIEMSFIELLADEGLIDLQFEDGVQYLSVSQLSDLERYARWHYDLSINIEGIDAIRHLLTRMEKMRQEIYLLRKRIAAYDGE